MLDLSTYISRLDVEIYNIPSTIDKHDDEPVVKHAVKHKKVKPVSKLNRIEVVLRRDGECSGSHLSRETGIPLGSMAYYMRKGSNSWFQNSDKKWEIK